MLAERSKEERNAGILKRSVNGGLCVCQRVVLCGFCLEQRNFLVYPAEIVRLI